jgi:hypothetical protein
MNKKLPLEAYAYYVSLSLAERSYDAVATKFDVCERTVADTAKRDHWQERIAEQERRARDRVDERAVETLAQMNERHLKVFRYVQGKSIETIKSVPLESAMDAIKAYALAAEKERLIRGEPTERTAMDIEKKIREEHERWLVPVEEDATDNAPASGGDPQAEQSPTVEEPGANENAGDDQPMAGGADGEPPADGGSSPEAPGPAV